MSAIPPLDARERRGPSLVGRISELFGRRRSIPSRRIASRPEMIAIIQAAFALDHQDLASFECTALRALLQPGGRTDVTPSYRRGQPIFLTGSGFGIDATVVITPPRTAHGDPVHLRLKLQGDIDADLQVIWASATVVP